MIPMTLASTSPPTPAAGRAAGAHHETGERAAGSPTAFSLDETHAAPPPDAIPDHATPDMGLTHAADTIPARAGHGNHGSYRWDEPDPAGARGWPTTGQPAAADPKSGVIPAGNIQNPTRDPAPHPSDRGSIPGDATKAGIAPLASGPAAAATGIAPLAAGPATAATATAATQGAQDIAGFVPLPAPASAGRQGSGRADHPAASQSLATATAQVTSDDTTGRTDAPAKAMVLPADTTGLVPDGGGDPGMSARDTDAVRTDPSRGDGLRADQPRADVVRAVGNQLVEAVRHGPNGNTEVALNPEELGRVRLGMTTQDGALHVSVMAERPETQDMLRRHIGQLQSDFRALGYTDVTFDFGHGGEQTARRPAPEPPVTASGDGADPGRTGGDMAAPSSAEASRIVATTARLDLRI